jgi:2,3-dihydroxybiphenyl 1,2-dioxygenase
MTGLGYVRLKAADLSAWPAFAEDQLGMQSAQGPGAGRLRWRVDNLAWRLEVMQAEEDGLAAVGWQIKDERALAELERKLLQSGIACCWMDEATCADRGVRQALQCSDPGGVELEMFVGPHNASDGFASPCGVRFVTGDQGFGHVVLFVKEYEACLEFYRGILNFRTSDWLVMDGMNITFLHCNPRHHSIALANADQGPRLLHFMLQVETLNEVGYAYDRCVSGGSRVMKTIGLHANDQMISFYVKTPSGVDVEYGCHGLRIDDEDAWQASTIPAPSLWGHKRVV